MTVMRLTDFCWSVYEKGVEPQAVIEDGATQEAGSDRPKNRCMRNSSCLR